MKIQGKVHCFFEQSGTFKKEFKKLGYKAFDYDIQNNFNETDYVIDLFNEIENAYDNKPSIFDNITEDDLIFAFFPCIYFCSMSQAYFDLGHKNIKHLDKKSKYDVVLKRDDNRRIFYQFLYKLYAICDINNLRLIIENPATMPHFLLGTQNFHRPSLIDKNRMLRGDFFKKPTAFWFLNCKPTNGFTIQKDKNQKIIERSKQGSHAGLCSEERSMISPDYARNFICDFILGEKQRITHQLKLF